jgi:succinate-semialdehyde dehydrogenase/glutarate-semialdehyde dehydrogenase
MSLGAGLDWDVDMGSLVSPAQMETVTKHVDDAVVNGATVLTGGKARPDLGPFFYEPTVLEGVTDAAQCFADETFGPLVSLYRYGSVDDAIQLANDGEYGLNASVWGPVRQARDIAAKIKAGTVNVNEGFAASFASIDAPMGGMRHSGTGRRLGYEGIHRYTEPQAVAVERIIPIFGPDSVPARRWASLYTVALRMLRRTPRA